MGVSSLAVVGASGMRSSIRIDTTGIEALVAGVESKLRAHGYTPSANTVLRTTVRQVIEGCIRRTPMASVDKIKRFFARKGNRVDAPGIAMSINSGERGGVQGKVWYGEDPSISVDITDRQREALRHRAKRGGKVWVAMDETRNPGAPMLRRFQAMEKLQKAKKRELKAKEKLALGARGLMRRSWFQCAERLGITLDKVAGGAQVGIARPSSGATYNPGNGRRITSAFKVIYEITNNFPFEQMKINGAAILSQSVQGVLSYYETNIRKGVFEDLNQILRAYKIKVN